MRLRPSLVQPHAGARGIARNAAFGEFPPGSGRMLLMRMTPNPHRGGLFTEGRSRKQTAAEVPIIPVLSNQHSYQTTSECTASFPRLDRFPPEQENSYTAGHVCFIDRHLSFKLSKIELELELIRHRSQCCGVKWGARVLRVRSVSRGEVWASPRYYKD